MGEHMNAAKHFKVATLVRYVHKNDHEADHLIEVDLPKLRYLIRVSPHLIVNELRQLVSEVRVQH